jgi:glycosyltransferase involved in cell wall biosynthesis
MALRIGIDASVLHGRLSGVEIAVRGLLEGLAAVDRENEYLVFAVRDAPRPELGANFEWHALPFSGRERLRRIAFQQGGLARVAVRLGLDLLHGPAYVTPIRSRVATIASVYDLMVLLHPAMCDAGNRLHYRWVLPRCLPRCRRIIVPSSAVEESLRALLSIAPERIVRAPLGIDSRFAPVTDEETLARVRGTWALPERFLLFVGNIEPKKGLSVLLDALGSLRKRQGWHVPLVIAGARAWGAEAFDRAVAGAGVGDLVLPLGYVPDADLPALYTLATAFIFPSLYEGFGLPPVEAMACGTPVLASDAGALPETVGDAALIVRSGDVADLAEGLVRIVGEEELRRELSKRAREHARWHSWEHHARAVLHAYKESSVGG